MLLQPLNPALEPSMHMTTRFRKKTSLRYILISQNVTCIIILYFSVVDPKSFFSDSGSDPALALISDPDSDPDWL
jgi:hypothetical protein